MTRRPPLFIGSSVEGLEVAYALQENLEFDCEPTVWPLHFLNSMADGVLSGRIDGAVARDVFQQPIIEIWTRAYAYFVPADGDSEDAWSPAPPLAVLASQWASIRT